MNENKTENKAKSYPIIAAIGVLSIYMIAQTGLIVNPALASLQEVYPNVPYSNLLLLSTIIGFVGMPFSLICGMIAGSKMKFKTIALIATPLVLIGGIAPYFLNSFATVLVSRIIVGIGCGFMVPLGASLIQNLYQGEQQSRLLGLGISVQNISGIVYQLLAGYLCAVNVNYIWFIYLFIIIPIVLIALFVPEPEKSKPVNKPAKEVIGGKTKVKHPLFVFTISVAHALCWLFLNAEMLNVSSIVAVEGLGTSSLAGIILSMKSIGGMLAGLLFAPVFRIFKRKWTIPISLAIQVTSLFIFCFISNPFVYMATSIISGFVLFIIWLAVLQDFNALLELPEQKTFANGLMVACVSIGVFFSSYFVGIVQNLSGNTQPKFVVFISGIGTLLVAAIWISERFIKKRYE